MATAREIVGQTRDLPSLPTVYLRLRQALNDPNVSISALGDLVARDPAVTARLLQAVNSALYGFPGRVHTVSRAIAILGMHQVHDLVLASCLAGTFNSARPAHLDMSRFWYGSVFRALAARHLARACHCLDVERPFINALLSDLGHLVLSLRVPHEALEARRHACGKGITLAQAEREVIGCDHAAVGAELLELWQLPTAICTAVRQHVEPGADGAYALEAGIVHVAAFVAAAAEDEQNLFAAEISPAAWRATGLDAALVPVVQSRVSGEIVAVVNLFFPQRAAA